MPRECLGSMTADALLYCGIERFKGAPQYASRGLRFYDSRCDSNLADAYRDSGFCQTISCHFWFMKSHFMVLLK